MGLWVLQPDQGWFGFGDLAGTYSVRASCVFPQGFTALAAVLLGGLVMAATVRAESAAEAYRFNLGRGK